MRTGERIVAAVLTASACLGAVACAENSGPPPDITLYCQNPADSPEVPTDSGQNFIFRTTENKGALLGAVAMEKRNGVYFPVWHAGVGDTWVQRDDTSSVAAVYQKTSYTLALTTSKDGSTVQAHCSLTKPGP